MSGTPPTLSSLLLSDSSSLINFLRIDRVDLLTSLPFALLVTDVVRAEITNRYQNNKLEEAIQRGDFQVVSLSDLSDLILIAQLKKGGLGNGESVSIVAAHKLGATLAMDDRTAAKRARSKFSTLYIINTQDIIVMNIRQGTLSVTEADTIKEDWALKHQFILKITSFGDLI